MKKLHKLIVGVFCAALLATSAVAAAAPVATNAPTNPDAWVLTVGGAGATTTTANSQTAFGVDLSLGRTGTLWLPLEAGVRQGIGYASGNGTVLSTKIYSDWTVLTYKKLDVFAGAGVGVTYGNTPVKWNFAPEAGVRVWIKKDVAIIGRIEYPFAINDSFRSQDNLTYVLGLQVRL